MQSSAHPAHQLVLTRAEELGREIAQGVSDHLKNMKESLLSGDDSGLTTTWQEICAQVQGEESFYWDEYVAVVESLISSQIEECSPAEQEMLWLHTDAGGDWLWNVVSAGGDEPPAHPGIDQQSIIEWICEGFLWRIAETDQDPRVARYLAQESGDDD